MSFSCKRERSHRILVYSVLIFFFMGAAASLSPAPGFAKYLVSQGEGPGDDGKPREWEDSPQAISNMKPGDLRDLDTIRMILRVLIITGWWK